MLATPCFIEIFDAYKDNEKIKKNNFPILMLICLVVTSKKDNH